WVRTLTRRQKLSQSRCSRDPCRKATLNRSRVTLSPECRERGMHHQTSLTESQKGVVRRYVEAWRRWRPGIRGFAEVEMDMENGSKVLADGITVDDRSELPVIVADARDHRFYSAIFDYDDDAEYGIEPVARPPTWSDGKAHAASDATINKKYRAIAFWEPQLVAACRHYVISDGPLPPRPEPRDP